MAAELTPAAVFDAVTETMGGAWEWGRADCCTGATAAFDRLFGFDPMPQRGRYDTQGGAARFIARLGGFDSAVDQTLRDAGLVPGDPVPGALGIVRQGGRRALGICIRPDIWAAKAEQGFVIVTNFDKAWICPD